MTSFAYTTGNPNNLVANQNASMADIQGPFTDIRTKFNDGTLDETNVPNLAAAFTTYKTALWGGTQMSGATAGTTLYAGASGQVVNPLAVGAANSGLLAFYLDPSDWTANARTTKMRFRVSWITNAVASGVTYTFGLYPVATFGGGSGVAATIATLGTVITGSTVAVTTPALSSSAPVTGSDFNAPAAGFYVLGMAVSGSMAANSFVTFVSHLQYRQV